MIKLTFGRDLENLSPNLSPARREALNSPRSLQKKAKHPFLSPLVVLVGWVEERNPTG